MLNIGDLVLHQQTGHSGKIIGYGHQMLDGAYLPTLVVRVVEATELGSKFFVEDFSSAWTRLEGKQSSQAA